MSTLDDFVFSTCFEQSALEDQVESDDEPECILESRSTELWCDSSVVVYTDGACRHNQSAIYRRAGIGAYWAEGHANNISQPLAGALQSNQRAELQAVILVLRIEKRAVLICSDSQYVVDGWVHYASKGAPPCWYGIHNSDLWKEFLEALSLCLAIFVHVKNSKTT